MTDGILDLRGDSTDDSDNIRPPSSKTAPSRIRPDIRKHRLLIVSSFLPEDDDDDDD